jgi:hypothetical protein
MPDDSALPSIAEDVAAQAQSRGKATATVRAIRSDGYPGLGRLYRVGEGVQRLAPAPYERKRGDPVYRPLRIYTADPGKSRLEGSVALVNVPFEPLSPGPVGKLLRVDNYNQEQHLHYRRADLDEPFVLMRSGYEPSLSDPRFHQQMAYAVCSNVYAAFRAALGRHPTWGFKREHEADKLVIRPHAQNMKNAYYDEDAGELCFGYYEAEKRPTDRTLPGGYVFTCLSHDVIVHEMTHALLDGLRAHFSEPTGADVIAFHEAFSDLVAVFRHFSYEEVVKLAIRKTRGQLEEAQSLTELAAQFGHTTGVGSALRSAIDTHHWGGRPFKYDETESNPEPHRRGSILVSAVFAAFVTVFKRKSERYLRLASNGSGLLPPGELPVDLQNVLAEKASRLASQFLNICIRAIDYCPPVDLRFGEYLRALITADHDLVPDDRWGYREALIDAFRARNIYPAYVTGLSEDALLWSSPRIPLESVEKLDFATLKFNGDPGRAACPEELHRQACMLGEFVTRAENLDEFGLVAQGDPRLEGDSVDSPTVESIRSSRRIGPDGQVVFDLVAEVTQRRAVRGRGGGPAFDFHGGSTVILGPDGEVRYVISKSVAGEDRAERRRRFLETEIAGKYWERKNGKVEVKPHLFRLLDA